MKVLWFSNKVLDDAKVSSTASWLFPIAAMLSEREDISFFNITFSSTIKKSVQTLQYKKIANKILPLPKLRNGFPSQKDIVLIKSVVDEINPDIIHMWGSEYFWGLLYTRGILLNRKVLLEVQGIKSVCSDVYFAGLSFGDILNCLRTKELLKPTLSLPYLKYSFKKWGVFEREMYSKYKYISVQSDWTYSQIEQYIGKRQNIYKTMRPVRESFFRVPEWSYLDLDSTNPSILFVSAYDTPYKGFHIALKALAIVKSSYPNVQLRVAGFFQQNKAFYRTSGYVKFINSFIQGNGLQDNVVFIGTRDGDELAQEMRRCHLLLQTSFVESYSAVLAESMAVGIPAVVSFAGAMPELAIHGESALFYSPGDAICCADHIKKLLSDSALSARISESARKIALKRNNIFSVIERQIEIYNSILSDS